MAKNQSDLLRVRQKKWLISDLKPSLNTWLLFSEDSLGAGNNLIQTFPFPQPSWESLRPRLEFDPLLSPSPVRYASEPNSRPCCICSIFVCLHVTPCPVPIQGGMGFDNRILVLLHFSLLSVCVKGEHCFPHSPKQRLGLLASLVIALLLCAHLHAYENVTELRYHSFKGAWALSSVWNWSAECWTLLGNQMPCPKGQKSSVCVGLVSGMNRWEGDGAVWKCWLVSNGCNEVKSVLEILSLCMLAWAPGHSWGLIFSSCFGSSSFCRISFSLAL